jgi:hypothetical protein
MPNNKFRYLDWENFDFPLLLTDLKLKFNFYALRNNCEIEIWRDQEYKFRGKISGFIEKEDDLKYKGEDLKKGSFIRGDIIECKSKHGVEIELRDCLIKHPVFRPGKKGELINFQASLYLRSIKKLDRKNESVFSITDWHICAKPELIFPRFTVRYENIFPYKFRYDIDDRSVIKESDDLTGYSLSRDFIILQIPQIVIVIQTINKKYLPDWSSGIAVEYRGDISALPNSDLRQGIAEFIGFILGVQLLSIGSTHFNDKRLPILSICSSAWGNNVISNCSQQPFPPIKIGAQNFEKPLSQLLNNYLAIRTKYGLNDVLWKLWIGKDQELGINLPTFSSGIESLAEKYIDEINLNKKYSKTEKKKYRNLIQVEFDSLKGKLCDYQFGKFLINKLYSPFNFGVGEKLSLFLEKIGILLDDDSVETLALRARNKMAHGTVFDLSEEEYIRYKRLTFAYITLYNRIMLKILNYNGHYIDYYNYGHPLVKMDSNIKADE